jgi:8-oxo-dGTP diphosphatase
MLEVTCAIIERNNKVLVAQRSDTMSLPLKWEFPGGKIERNENAESCLLREIAEELSIQIEIIQRLSDSVHAYSESKIIKLIPFVCKLIGGELILTEHAQYLWLDKSELTNLDWADADIPVLNNYLSLA